MNKYWPADLIKTPYCQVPAHRTVTFQNNVLSRYIISYTILSPSIITYYNDSSYCTFTFPITLSYSSP